MPPIVFKLFIFKFQTIMCVDQILDSTHIFYNVKYCLPEVIKEKGTLILPVEEIEINRDLPKYVPPVRFQPIDSPKRPAIVMDLNGVLCASWFCKGTYSEAPDLDAKYFSVVQESQNRSRPC